MKFKNLATDTIIEPKNKLVIAQCLKYPKQYKPIKDKSEEAKPEKPEKAE